MIRTYYIIIITYNIDYIYKRKISQARFYQMKKPEHKGLQEENDGRNYGNQFCLLTLI